ncbi:hypothetical protein [Desulfolutivibrio sp.]|uniref:hypothetical protein n=1 Tax=Desulfolutivibrio sp. TaxID=2773296 RepID=UPI002F9616F1
MSAITEKIKQLLAFTVADNDEGREGSRGRIFESGHTRDYLTIYGGIDVVEQESAGDSSRGIIKFSFNCRVREKWYEMGAETNSKDYNAPGEVTAEYLYAFGKLMVSGVKRNGSEGRCARSIINKIINICQSF